MPARADAGTTEALFYAAPVAIALLDRDLRIATLNEPMRTLLGYTGGRGKPLSSFPLGTVIEPLCRGVLESGEATSQAIYTERRRHHALIYPVASQEFAGLGVIIADVKSPGSCPMDAQKSESIARLAAAMAHHFNNLLTGIMGGASLALDRLSPGHPARSAVEIVMDSSKRAAELTHQLLAYSGGAPCRISPINLELAIRRTCAQMRPSIPAQVELQVEAATNLPRMKMDEFGFHQALKSLIVNAVEAIGDRPGVVKVAVRSAEMNGAGIECDLGNVRRGRYLELVISDSGCGMDAETKAKMFEPFFSTKLFGRGIGLAAVQNLIRVHDGCVRVRTEPGGGTTVSVYVKQASEAVCAGGHAPR